MFSSFEKLNATREIDAACASPAEPQAVLPLMAVPDPVLSATEQMPREEAVDPPPRPPKAALLAEIARLSLEGRKPSPAAHDANRSN